MNAGVLFVFVESTDECQECISGQYNLQVDLDSYVFYFEICSRVVLLELVIHVQNLKMEHCVMVIPFKLRNPIGFMSVMTEQLGGRRVNLARCS